MRKVELSKLLDPVTGAAPVPSIVKKKNKSTKLSPAVSKVKSKKRNKKKQSKDKPLLLSDNLFKSFKDYDKLFQVFEDSLLKDIRLFNQDIEFTSDDEHVLFEQFVQQPSKFLRVFFQYESRYYSNCYKTHNQPLEATTQSLETVEKNIYDFFEAQGNRVFNDIFFACVQDFLSTAPDTLITKHVIRDMAESYRHFLIAFISTISSKDFWTFIKYHDDLTGYDRAKADAEFREFCRKSSNPFYKLFLIDGVVPLG